MAASAVARHTAVGSIFHSDLSRPSSTGLSCGRRVLSRARALLCARVGSCCLHFSGSRSLAAMISWTVTFYGVPNTEKGKFDLTPPQVQSVHRRHEIASPHPSSRRGRTSSPLVTLPVAGRSAGDEDEDATHACSFRENLSLRFLRTGRQILLTLPSS